MKKKATPSARQRAPLLKVKRAYICQPCKKVSRLQNHRLTTKTTN